MAEKALKLIIVEILKQNHLLSVAEFLDVLKKDGKSYNKTSVYRALEQLISEDAVCQHHFSSSEASYELREHHHTHLVCKKCGKIQTAECHYHETPKVGNFLVEHHHVTLFGLCENCQ